MTLLHFPGGLTDEQYARFEGRGESTNRVFYDWYRSEESSLTAFMTERQERIENNARIRESVAKYQAQQRRAQWKEETTELIDDPDYNAFLERADLYYDEERLARRGGMA